MLPLFPAATSDEQAAFPVLNRSIRVRNVIGKSKLRAIQTPKRLARCHAAAEARVHITWCSPYDKYNAEMGSWPIQLGVRREMETFDVLFPSTKSAWV